MGSSIGPDPGLTISPAFGACVRDLPGILSALISWSGSNLAMSDWSERLLGCRKATACLLDTVLDIALHPARGARPAGKQQGTTSRAATGKNKDQHGDR